jgi:hypothetical protein
MSWDIFVQDIPEDIKQISDMHEKYSNFKPRPISTRSEIIRKIKNVVPEVDFSSPSWGIIDGAGFSIEVNMGDQEECLGFAFHVRGGDAAAFVICDILESLSLRAFDPSSETGLFEIGPDAVASLQRWRQYRNKVLKNE